jgi:hypothetical protein
MKILLTGASGLIGGRLVYRLLHEGHDLVLIGRNAKRLQERFPIPCEIREWNPDKPASEQPALREAFNGVQAVIHLAGEPVVEKRWSDERKRRIRNSRVHGTRGLVDALIEHPGANPSVFISASAIGFYGDRGDAILEESSVVGQGFLAEVCRDWEREAKRACEIAPKIRCVQMRIGVVLSRDGGALSRLAPAFESGLGGPIGDGKQWMSWIHAEDLVNLIAEALKNPQLSGPVNAVAPQPVTNRQFSQALAQALQKPCRLSVPKLALKLALGEMSEALLWSERVFPSKALQAGFKFQFPTIQDAFSDLFPEWYRNSQREFVAHQWVPQSVDEIFSFFSDEKNLEAITPAWLNFHVLKKSTEKMEAGTQVDYKLRLRGFPLRWQSKIEEWIPNQKFVDLQTRGPYSHWRHTHVFTPLKGGTLLTDRVLYKVPFGKVGALTAGKLVENDVGKIFEYRRHKIEELFSTPLKKTGT